MPSLQETGYRKVSRSSALLGIDMEVPKNLIPLRGSNQLLGNALYILYHRMKVPSLLNFVYNFDLPPELVVQYRNMSI